MRARELKEEAGVTACRMRSLGEYAITSESGARLSLFLAEDLRLGAQELTDTEARPGSRSSGGRWTTPSKQREKDGSSSPPAPSPCSSPSGS
ncbi:hypothetical protein ABZV29_42430 [Streptomyces sp. NPDC005236]|uniref:hypothetical protein n=1 Tax=Streptomyces sp. NPDC005236 TaxID=3157028 RepID=UPI0033A1AC85